MKKILILFLLVFFAASGFTQNDYKKITIDDLWRNYAFYPESVYGLRSMNDGEHYTTLNRSGELEKFAYQTGDRVSLIVNTSDLNIGRVSDYHFNADESKILLLTNREDIYRHSFFADYYIYDTADKSVEPLSEKGSQQVASFSPDGEKVAFVRNNNIFIKFLESGEEKQITQDGEYNKIINGIPDWVYEEEFGYNQAYTWMPNSKSLAFVKFDESEVPMFGMPIYAGLSPNKEENALYPEYYTFKYPKAGDTNSKVSVHVFHLEDEKTITCEIGDETDIYIPRIRPIKASGNLAIFRLNRLQNKLELLETDISNGQTEIFFTEENERYIEEAFLDNVYFFDDGDRFAVTSERDGYRHIYLHKISDKNFAEQITAGKWDLTDFYGFNDDNERFYFAAAKETPIRREIYSAKLKGGKVEKLTEQTGYNNAAFSSNFSYFINYFSSSKTPTQVSLHSGDGKLVRILKENEALLERAEEYGGVNKEFFTFKTSQGTELNAFMVKPPNFDKNKTYPVVVTQYSGPASQTVTDSWSFGWNNLLSQEGIIVVGVDPRGTGARGEDFRKQTYLQLGKYETIDLIETAKYLQSLDYVKADKIGVWGWSYGGFETLLCLTKGADTYAAGIAVAPVTNWRYYDTVYTERFMRTPQENAEGYDNNSPINFVSKLEDPVLIIHGTADDNVHLQNTKEFVEALVQAGKQFRMHEYTNRNHGIYGGNTRHHLYTMMLDFWREYLLNK
jgi:dipeptidyl-peptidase-4